MKMCVVAKGIVWLKSIGLNDYTVYENIKTVFWKGVLSSLSVRSVQ